MGETAVDTRREVEQTRQELDGTIAELRNRGEQAQAAVKRRAPVVLGGVALVAGGTLATVLVVRSRRRSRLPKQVQRSVDVLGKRREQLVEAIAERVAEQQARALRKADPLWRRTTGKALETAAAVGAAALVRSLVAGTRAR